MNEKGFGPDVSHRQAVKPIRSVEIAGPMMSAKKYYAEALAATGGDKELAKAFMITASIDYLAAMVNGVVCMLIEKTEGENGDEII